MRCLSLVSAVLACSWTTATAALAAEGPPVPAAPPPVAARVVVAAAEDPCCLRCPQWHFTIGAWLYGLDGTIAAGGRTVDVESEWYDAFDYLDDVEFALDARLRLETGRWRFTAGVDGSTLAESAGFLEGTLEVDAELALWSAYATVGYVVAGGMTDCSPCAGTWCLDAYAGVRFWSVGVEMAGSIGAATPVDRDETWVDPIVGLHLNVTWPKWILVLEADVGGFGVGSDFAWGALGAVGYRFTCHFALVLGWKALDVDREDGDFRFDVTQSGPFVALNFTF